MEVEKSLLLEVEAYAANFITEQVPDQYAYHDVQHTINVVAAVKEIGEEINLSDREMDILVLAAWFHDMGYDKGSLNHEERSARYAEEYLSRTSFPEQDLEQIKGCIMATCMPHNPATLLQKVICDADLSHLGKKIYWDRCSRVRQELTLSKNIMMNEQECVDFELDFITKHRYQN